MLLNQAFHQSPIGMCLVSLEGKWIKVNPALCKITGYSEEELLSLNYENIIYPEDKEKYLRERQEFRTGKRNVLEMEIRYMHKQGHIVWGCITASVVCEGNEPLFFISQIQDISERKQADQKIRESEKRHYDLIELSADAIFIHQDGQFVYINHAGLKLFRTSHENQLLGRPIYDVVHPDYRELAEERIHQSYEGKKMKQESGHPADRERKRSVRNPSGKRRAMQKCLQTTDRGLKAFLLCDELEF